MCAEPKLRAHLEPGLCKSCAHSRRMESDRGSTFYLCELSLRDSRYPKYPRLPVLECGGYQPDPLKERQNH